MSDVTLLLVVVGAAVVLLVTQLVRTEVTALGVIAVLALTGLLSPGDALAGFSSPATITVAAMLVLSAGLEKAGVVDAVAARLLGLGSRGEGGEDCGARLLLVLAVPTAIFSAFMNNTAIIALMIPVTLTLGRRLSVPSSRLLLPLSYVSILAGTATLIGTSTNILVHSLARSAGHEGFGMFEFSGMGLLYLVVGGAYTMLLAPRVLPQRHALGEVMPEAAEGRFVTEVTIPPDSSLVGRTLSALLQGAEPVVVLELVREEEATLRPDPETTLRGGDALIIEASAKAVHALLERRGVEAGTGLEDTERVVLSRTDLRMVEAVVTPGSRLRNRRVSELGLFRLYGVQVLAVRRLGRHHQYQIRRWRLRAGDVLLVLGPPGSLRLLQEEGDVLLVQGVGSTLVFPRKAPLAVAILAGVVALAALGVAPIEHLAIAGAALMLLTNCMDTNDATRALDPTVLLLLAGTIPLGLAMEQTGLAASIAHTVMDTAGAWGPVALVSGLYLLTSVLTEVLSNNATAVLLTPIALQLATQAGLDPKPLLVAIAFGGSASFATPIGYQTNTLVMGPGGYRFGDYLRFGLPLNLIMWITATLLIPVFWSL